MTRRGGTEGEAEAGGGAGGKEGQRESGGAEGEDQ